MAGPTESVANLVRETVASQTEAEKSVTTKTPAPSGSQAEGADQLPAYLPADLRDKLLALPTDARSAALEWSKSLYGDYQRKTTDVARRSERVAALEGIVTEMEQDPSLKQAVEQAYHAKKAGLPTITQTKTEAKRVLDQWMEGAQDPLVRQNIGLLRQAIEEETDVKVLKQELADLKRSLGQFQSTQAMSVQEQVTAKLTGLPESYQPLIEKYRTQIVGMVRQNPALAQLSAKKLLSTVAEDDEYEAAVKAGSVQEVKQEITKAKQTATAKPQQAVSQEGSPAKLEPKPHLKGWFGNKHDLKQLIPKMVEEAQQKLAV